VVDYRRGASAVRIIAAAFAFTAAFSALLNVSEAQLSHWQLDVRLDRVSDKKEVRFRNDALQNFVQFGRPVTASLYLYCMKDTPPQAQALVYFSQSVGAEGHVKFRFDNGEVRGGLWQLYNNGQMMNLFIGTENVSPLLRSSRLRMEWLLPWAKDVFLEFDTRGAQEARSKLPC